MNVWHGTADTPRFPEHPKPRERISLRIGSWPIEPGQQVWIELETKHTAGASEYGRVDAQWLENSGPDSYWEAELGPFLAGDCVSYVVHAASPRGAAASIESGFKVAPRLCLALMWHHHQPIYKESSSTASKGRFLEPWVRLHAIRDYYSMAALVSECPDLHLTINLTPALLSQLEDYLENGSVDEALELTLKPAKMLDAKNRERMLSTFFEANWHNQIFIHPRYRELFMQRAERRPFSMQDLQDLQVWFNLAWFASEFRNGEVRLATGEVASVRKFVEQARGFTPADIESIVTEQYKIMRAIVPIHRKLENQGQLELSTTPFYHPILPLLVDTDRATIDRPGTSFPKRFARPEDATLQIALAAEAHERWFQRRARGIWPAEGAVAQFAIPFFAAQGVQWIASDRGVLARSGKWGYRVEDADVLARAYRAEEGESKLAVFFRDTELSDDIGFRCYDEADATNAARAWVARLKDRFGRDVRNDERIVTVILDGENPWGSYRDDGHPFLRALYDALQADADIATVTFSEYLSGNPERGIGAHALDTLEPVHDLFTGSWIDETGSIPGVDLGTWIGEPEENRAWELLGLIRREIEKAASKILAAGRSVAREAILAAEGSDWFWWFGSDQDSGHDEQFDELFRLHLSNACRAIGHTPPAELALPIVRTPVVWSFTRHVDRIKGSDVLIVRTHCPGVLRWSVDAGAEQEQSLHAVGGVMAGASGHELTLGPFGESARVVRFHFQCRHQGCDHSHPCCRFEEHSVSVGSAGQDTTAEKAPRTLSAT